MTHVLPLIGVGASGSARRACRNAGNPRGRNPGSGNRAR